jgi:sialate O-acetylesterase
MKTKYVYLFFAFAILLSNKVEAEVILPKIISSNMVLQREMPVPVWGKADIGEKVTVEFAGQHVSTFAGQEGKWTVTLKPLKPSNHPSNMIISGKNTIILNNILVGDVWLCSGQSNMEYPLDYRLKKHAAPQRGKDVALEELSKPKSDQIRYILAEKHNETEDIKSVGWITAENDSVLRNISAIGYFFGKEIHEKTQIPIGIISSSWGGTSIEVWTPRWAYEKSPFFKPSIKEKDFKIDGTEPGTKFESMIRPIIPFAVKGMLWYQGETNCMKEDQQTYPEKVKLLVETYRSLFKNPQMPFYYVQIAPYLYSRRTNDKQLHTPETLPEFWEAQTKCLSIIPNSGMVVITDLVDKLTDIHPPYKWEVARRLSLIALNRDYGKKEVCYSPVCQSMKVKEDKLILSFKNTGSGLISKDGQPLNWFTIAGSDGKFVPAKAEMKDNKIIVWSDDIPHPMAVRFGWNESAMPNLFNKEGLPAVPFRMGIK